MSTEADAAPEVATTSRSWWRHKIPTLLWLAAAGFGIGALIALA
jgi:uncharacterized membrane protein